jgi:hypothetical protein
LLDEPYGHPGRLAMWMLLEGAAELQTAEGYSRRFSAGETVLVPASCRGAGWKHCGAAPAVAIAACV